MIKDFLVAAGNYKKYGELTKRSGLRIAAYVILLLLVCSIGLIIVPTFTLGAKTVAVIWEDIPAFTLTESGMTIEKDFDLELSGVKILATNERQLTEADFGENTVTGVLMDSDSVIIHNFNRTLEFGYGEFGTAFSVKKSDLVQLKPVLLLSGLLVCVMLWLSHAISFVLNGLFIGALAGVVSMFMKIRLSTGKLIKLGMYSQTLPYVAASILGVFGIHIASPALYIVSVALIFLWFRTLPGGGNEPDSANNGTEN